MATVSAVDKTHILKNFVTQRFSRSVRSNPRPGRRRSYAKHRRPRRLPGTKNLQSAKKEDRPGIMASSYNARVAVLRRLDGLDIPPAMAGARLLLHRRRSILRGVTSSHLADNRRAEADRVLLRNAAAILMPSAALYRVTRCCWGRLQHCDFLAESVCHSFVSEEPALLRLPTLAKLVVLHLVVYPPFTSAAA